MTKQERETISGNAQKINSLGADSIVTEVKTKMEDNVRGALIGGGIGVTPMLSMVNYFLVQTSLSLLHQQV